MTLIKGRPFCLLQSKISSTAKVVISSWYLNPYNCLVYSYLLWAASIKVIQFILKHSIIHPAFAHHKKNYLKDLTMSAKIKD